MRFVLAPLQKQLRTRQSIILFKGKNLIYAYREQISRHHATRLPIRQLSHSAPQHRNTLCRLLSQELAKDKNFN